MTREEAKHRLLNIERCTPIHTREDVRDLEALEMAIKALEQNESAEEWYKLFVEKLEQEPCDNAVSRQAVLDAMYELCNTRETLKENPWRDNPHIDAITDAINNLQPIKPQEKTGHCKDCKYFEYDSVVTADGIPLIVAHEICSKWGDGCKTKEDGYCFLFEPIEEQESEDEE